jgi:hypothetical protein
MLQDLSLKELQKVMNSVALGKKTRHFQKSQNVSQKTNFVF